MQINNQALISDAIGHLNCLKNDFARLRLDYNSGKSGQIDHLIPEQSDHHFRMKLTTPFRSKLTT